MSPTPALALVLVARGVGALPERVPSVWCTAPTVERWNIGYSVNGPFQLDVGRGQLARANDANVDVFKTLGDLLGGALTSLFEALERDFSQTAALLGLDDRPASADRVKREFSSSLFDCLTGSFTLDTLPRESLADQRRFLQAIHSDGRGISRVVRAEQALPARLSGQHDVLTSVGAVRWVIDEDLWPLQCSHDSIPLSWFVKNVPPGSAVRADVRIVLDNLRCAPIGAMRLSASSSARERLPGRACAHAGRRTSARGALQGDRAIEGRASR